MADNTGLPVPVDLLDAELRAIGVALPYPAAGWVTIPGKTKRHYIRAGQSETLCGQPELQLRPPRLDYDHAAKGNCVACQVKRAPTGAELAMMGIAFLGMHASIAGVTAMTQATWDQRMDLGKWLATETAAANDHNVRRRPMPAWADGVFVGTQ